MDGANTFRQGYFIGDGTGCGKSRQVASTTLAGASPDATRRSGTLGHADKRPRTAH
ncbi:MULTISPECIES: strawberry notch-like NTP hydrolase domain-containing protein [unclassified Roseobacter]|uniref:strawberry notch-like NTP hydrolase domain-containing protein n=1 Tax=unclassified Roseobacter TaxID=196798 RepID=UPI0014919DFA|nr:hypothetical protein [Roseobacter sp. HKCCD8914]NNW47505.1 hypothetical protein [Roseobacter sp. HKCCD8291]NNX92307.1 hypothetical protein [Roseobacter sp. HKCCD9056]NNX96568.1 hypothetical protein [Roseobacter sp. HKCCD9042]NNZ07377.1 hypothetical protein [Roseobacter sp. HKCCD7415]NNZ20125.1 hypothetical protein [Roseobacter sp. HKCCD6301]NNZ49921.1 hypothetical protein [Roseobacter sp. HKCCD6540]NNZ66921.1 hypothetical protein [Roseobacter sp. HKCCD5928]NNZ71199.1 hypothetical protein